MHATLPSINGKANYLDERARLQLQDSLRAASESTETALDTLLRLYNANLEVTMAKIGCDLGIFKTVAATQDSTSVGDLAAQTGANPILLERILRYLASVRMITETGKGEYAANQTSLTLADPGIQGSLFYIFNVSNPIYQALPDTLREQNYQSPSHGKLAFNKAMSTDLEWFPWVKQHPKELSWFQTILSVHRDGDWLDVFPLSTDCAMDRAHFVDVGGSIGHQCRRLKDKYPHLPGRVICQDLEETIASAAPPAAADGVEMIVHDFFTPQPIQDAKYYYLRTVLHDWSDEKCEAILCNLIAAMGPDSVILIDEMVLPNTGVHWWSACLDLQMYAILGSQERNVEQWEALMRKCGLKIVEIKIYMPIMRNSIIVAVPMGKDGGE
ncbi:MAG: hypothetical protein LQ352_004209 [Teloschistes flavicans]|nr:MAG: hypothetical protein LQ352_004209 [Teloschistes flavicans]